MAPTISATQLGYYASSRFCPRCAWVRMHVKNLPYQNFPGIFSTIDRYNKLIIRNYFQQEHSLPAWLNPLGEAIAYVDPPHWSKFKILDEASGLTLRGEADGIFRMADGTYVIIDYKTSKYSGAQRAMLKSYETQLNAYAFIGERLEEPLVVSPVGRLALVYMEPQTEEETVLDLNLTDEQGFIMGFAANVVEVDLKPEKLIPPLLRKVKAIAELERPPASKLDCKDCLALDSLIDNLGR